MSTKIKGPAKLPKTYRELCGLSIPRKIGARPPDTFASWPGIFGWVRGVVLSLAPMDLLEKARLHLPTAIIAF
jgi:hypothetical protein